MRETIFKNEHGRIHSIGRTIGYGFFFHLQNKREE